MGATRRYAPGQHVEYNSLSNGRWIEAIVDYVHSDGTVDLDVRDRVCWYHCERQALRAVETKLRARCEKRERELEVRGESNVFSVYLCVCVFARVCVCVYMRADGSYETHSTPPHCLCCRIDHCWRVAVCLFNTRPHPDVPLTGTHITCGA